MTTKPGRLLRPLILSLLLLLLIGIPAAAQTTLTGQTEGGAFYRIEVPEGWTPASGLVIWNHGFDLGPVEALDEGDLGPLAAVQLAQGYAVAASSYSLNGWALFETADDLRDMVAVFEMEVGVPDQVLITGASLGGIVTAQAIETDGLGNVTGALPLCGAVAGSRVWDAALDLRLLYDAVCGEVPGAAIPGGAMGLPFPPDPSFDDVAMAGAVNVCTGILFPPEARTPEQAGRLDAILDVAGIPESFLLTDMGFATFALADLVYDPRKLGGMMALDNANVEYGDATINASIERVMADPAARRFLLDNYTPTGQVGDTKIVSIHTDKDGLVIVENETTYADAVPANRLTLGVVVEDVPSHCGFTEAEVVASWETLRGWVAGFPQPTAADLQATCEAIAAGGLAQGPCRIDPEYELPPAGDRYRPRDVCVPNGETLCLGEAGRFRFTADWTTDTSGTARVGEIQTADTGTFWFFNADNIELTVKALDGRGVNGKFWVFYASMTNVEFEMTVTDTVTGLRKVYENSSGSFASVGDTNAF